jgi:hypothetical protein
MFSCFVSISLLLPVIYARNDCFSKFLFSKILFYTNNTFYCEKTTKRYNLLDRWLRWVKKPEFCRECNVVILWSNDLSSSTIINFIVGLVAISILWATPQCLMSGNEKEIDRYSRFVKCVVVVSFRSFCCEEKLLFLLLIDVCLYRYTTAELSLAIDDNGGQFRWPLRAFGPIGSWLNAWNLLCSNFVSAGLLITLVVDYLPWQLPYWTQTLGKFGVAVMAVLINMGGARAIAKLNLVSAPAILLVFVLMAVVAAYEGNLLYVCITFVGIIERCFEYCDRQIQIVRVE